MLLRCWDANASPPAAPAVAPHPNPTTAQAERRPGFAELHAAFVPMVAAAATGEEESVESQLNVDVAGYGRHAAALMAAAG